MRERLNYVFIGADVHKEQHTAVVTNCFEDILGDFTFASKISEYPKIIEKINNIIPDGLIPIWGLEDVSGNGRSLAAFLKDNGYIVKEVNPSYSSSERKNHPTTKKNDYWDAQCIANVLMRRYKELPDANPNDLYWTLKQVIYRRDSLVKSATTTKIQLHEQLVKNYTSYKKFFSEIDGNTALAFWEKYPSPRTLRGVTPMELRTFLLEASKNACSLKKATSILELVEGDGDTFREYQSSRDELVRSYVRGLKFYKKEIENLNKQVKDKIGNLDYKLETLTGVGTVTAGQLIAEIGDISRFKNAEKLAQYAGVAPVRFSSAGKGKDKRSKQGNRNLNGVLYFLAMQQIQISKKSKMPRNPILYDYYQKKLTEGKTKVQALICIMRRLVNIIFGMMKNKTEYVMKYRHERIAN